MQRTRNLFDELNSGFEDLQKEREGKITLRRMNVVERPVPEFSATDLISLRTALNVSRAVLAAYLRINPRTLENWEQGRSTPNAQARLLLKMVEKYPDTIDRLSAV